MNKLRFLFVFLCSLMVCSSVVLMQGPAQAELANGPVSAQCSHTYSGVKLDFTNAHRSGHQFVDIQLQGNNSATVTCPAPIATTGKAGGYAVQTQRAACGNNTYFELVTNNSAFYDCFTGTGYLSVYITQIDDLFWRTFATTIAYTPPGQHWYYCYNNPGVNGFGSNDGLINVINIADVQGGFCPNPLP